MKKIKGRLFLVFVLSVSTTVSFAQRTTQSNEGQPRYQQRILENFERQKNCWNAEDLDCYMNAYSKWDDLKAVTSNGVTTGYDDILARYIKHFPKGKMGELSFHDFDFNLLTKRLCFVTGRFRLKLKDRNEPFDGWFSVIMKKHGKQWYIVTDHS